MLGGAGLLDEAHAAMHLDGVGGDLLREIGAPGLHHRGQQGDPLGGQGALARIRMALAAVDEAAVQ